MLLNRLKQHCRCRSIKLCLRLFTMLLLQHNCSCCSSFYSRRFLQVLRVCRFLQLVSSAVVLTSERANVCRRTPWLVTCWSGLQSLSLQQFQGYNNFRKLYLKLFKGTHFRSFELIQPWNWLSSCFPLHQINANANNTMKYTRSISFQTAASTLIFSLPRCGGRQRALRGHTCPQMPDQGWHCRGHTKTKPFLDWYHKLQSNHANNHKALEKNLPKRFLRREHYRALFDKPPYSSNAVPKHVTSQFISSQASLLLLLLLSINNEEFRGIMILNYNYIYIWGSRVSLIKKFRGKQY